MLVQTFGDLRDKISRELDLEDEAFIVADEMLGYYNDAVDDAEAEILGIYEDYFLTSALLPLELGVETYSLPADIYANKIRRIIYNNGGTNIYEVLRVRDWKKFLKKAVINTYATNDQYYQYMLQNVSADDGVQLVLIPSSKETSEENVRIWYIRNANRATTDSDKCDIPEFTSFITAHMRCSVRRKEFNGDVPQADLMELERQRKLMIDTLTVMVPDDQTEIESDLSHYGEHV